MKIVSFWIFLGILSFMGQTMAPRWLWASDLPSECERALLAEPNEDGQVAEFIPLTSKNLGFAYRNGVFPWITEDDGSATWFSPLQRGILDFSQMHVPRKDMQFIRRMQKAGAASPYRVTYDQAFGQVMREAAAQVRPDSGDTWITPAFMVAYEKLFSEGQAHSVEVWEGNTLVGGLYGVFFEGVFAGESMFHKRDDVAKLALWSLVERLRANGHAWMDTQQVAGLVAKWGGVSIPRPKFMELLRDAQKANRPF